MHLLPGTFGLGEDEPLSKVRIENVLVLKNYVVPVVTLSCAFLYFGR